MKAALPFLLSLLALPPVAAEDWLDDWALPTGFRLELDAEGFALPTALAFVPRPGPGPKDPRYFVAELRGRVRVVTNDGTVLTFAEEFFLLQAAGEIPEPEGEVGLAGITLDPEHGYVFVSYAYQDEGGTLRNGITRFSTPPGTFSVEPRETTHMRELFANHLSNVAHQIGPLAVLDGALFVCVGDAGVTALSQDLSSPNGKILRLTLDGQPHPGNPLAGSGNQVTDALYAWGFRNPFGLTTARDRLFASDNGPDVDRFVEVQAGRNYGYDGTDWSMGTGALAVFAPAVSPVQMDFLDTKSGLFPPEDGGRFYLALSGKPSGKEGPGRRGEKAVVSLEVDFARDQVLGTPQPFLKYVGAGQQVVVACAVGPDGLYMAGLLPVKEGGTAAVLKITHDPANPHPHQLEDRISALELLTLRGCLSCHQGSEGAGPSLTYRTLIPRLTERLGSDAYREQSARVDGLTEDPFPAWAEARQEVLELDGAERTRTWLVHHLREPRFDNPDARMPNLGLSRQEAAELADYLTTEPPSAVGAAASWALVDWLPHPVRLRHLGLAFLVGGLAGGLGVGVVWGGVIWLRRRRRGH